MSSVVQQTIGVIGAGSFGKAIALLLSKNNNVLLYSRTPTTVETINKTHRHAGIDLPHNILATSSMSEITDTCRLIFPVVSSHNFRDMMSSFSSYLRPYHILIHATKGLDVPIYEGKLEQMDSLKRTDVFSMSEVISQECMVLRIGCLSGPNLAKEIILGHPTGTVIASPFDEVIAMGQAALSSDQFFVFGSHDMRGAELAGALKNILAIGSGLLGGLGMGKNSQAMLITRGLHEMIRFGSAMDTTSKAFLGTAGIADLVATATSENSRNYTFGYRLANGETKDQILNNSEDIYEGVRTILIVHLLAAEYKIELPIMNLIYRAVYQGLDIRKSMKYLMRIPQIDDVEFI